MYVCTYVFTHLPIFLPSQPAAMLGFTAYSHLAATVILKACYRVLPHRTERQTASQPASPSQGRPHHCGCRVEKGEGEREREGWGERGETNVHTVYRKPQKPSYNLECDCKLPH